MKQMILKNWMVAALLTGACCGLVACDDDDQAPPVAPDVTAVVGEYAGLMSILELHPTEGEDEIPAGTALNATVAGTEIQLDNFPIRDLIVKILGTEEGVDKIIEAVGPVNYAVPYTAVMSDNKESVVMTLTPEPLTLTIGEEEETPAAFAQIGTLAGEPLVVEVAITAGNNSAYSIGSKALTFNLSVASVKLGAGELPGFKPFSLDFEMTKK